MADNQGFLLLEVMLSIVILTAGLLFVTRAYSSCGQAIERSQDLFKAGLLMENEMFSLEEKGAISQGSWQGQVEGHQDFAWAIKGSPAQDLDLETVCLTVSRVKQPQEGYSLWTYLDKSQTVVPDGH